VKTTNSEERQKRRLDAVYLASVTLLERFIIHNEIKPAHLSAVSGYSRQHLLRIRMGRMEPTRRCIAAILSGIRLLTQLKLTVVDLFEFEDGPREPTEPRPKRRRRRKRQPPEKRGTEAEEAQTR